MNTDDLIRFPDLLKKHGIKSATTEQAHAAHRYYRHQVEETLALAKRIA